MVCILFKLETIEKTFLVVLSSIKPIIYASIAAYIVNLMMVKIEYIIRKWAWANTHTRCIRPISILLSLLIIISMGILLISIVLPTLLKSIEIFISSIPHVLNKYQGLFESISLLDEGSLKSNFNIDWQQFVTRILTWLGNTITNSLNLFLSIVSTTLGQLFNLLLIFVFSIYVLLEKERLIETYKKLTTIFLGNRVSKVINYVITILHETMSAFISGQIIEAFIMGSLCILGLSILRIPYPVMLGTVIGITNMIPIFGAYFGGILGFIIILSTAPKLAILFVVFIIVMQQIESNLIYPKIMGNSVGLPGVYILGTVIIMAPIAGIAGMFFGIPLNACIYKIVKSYVQTKLENENILY